MASNGNGKESGWFEKHSDILRQIDTTEQARLKLRAQVAAIGEQLKELDEKHRKLLAELDEGLGRKKKGAKPKESGTGVMQCRAGSASGKLLRILDDLGTASRDDLAEQMEGITGPAISSAINRAIAAGAVERLKDGSYALTEPQQAAMRVEA